jgi:hypothetical protein
MDPEDGETGDQPDRTLVWTRYRRNRASLASQPLLTDDTYAALATRCLGRACDLVLAALGEDLTPIYRLLSLLQALVGGVAALRLTADSRAACFAFHRDTLIRAFLVQRNVGPNKVLELLAQLDRRRQAMGTFPASLRTLAEKEWGGVGGEGTGEDTDAAWRSSIADLFLYVSRFRGDPEYHLDPFAEDAGFPVLFKVFHGLANQLGVGLLDEIFAHHLLLGAALPPGTAAPRVRVHDVGDVETPVPSPPKPEVRGGRLWYHFIARSSLEGKRWVEEYRSEQWRLAEMSDHALQQLRRQQLREGKDLLDQVASRLEETDGIRPSVLLVLQRFYWATLAYYHYCIGELDQAERLLDRAQQAVVSAIETEPFLLPFAMHCHEFRLQNARVARYRRRWHEMRERLQEVRGMLENQLPLCALTDGRPIYFSNIVEFLRAIPSLDAEELESLRFFLDDEHRREYIQQALMSLYVLPGAVIQYP